MQDPGVGQQLVSQVPRSIDLDDQGTLVLRAAGPDDVDAVKSLYDRLGEHDLERRFFTAHTPPDATIERWLSGGEHGGLVLLAEIVDGDSTTAIAEGGYSVLPDGAGELGITVDPAWRGWVGPWLLDAVATEAAVHGVGELEAEVLATNRPMRIVLQRRGHAVVDHPDWQHVRLVVSTTGVAPSWPENERPNLLVVAPSGRWSGEGLAQELGFDVRTCPGPTRRSIPCPALAGDGCPLVDGADALVFALPADEPRRGELLDVVRARRTELPVVVIDRSAPTHDRPPCATAAEVMETITAALDQVEGA